MGSYNQMTFSTFLWMDKRESLLLVPICCLHSKVLLLCHWMCSRYWMQAFSHPLCLLCIACLALLFIPVLSQPHTTLDGSKLTDDIRDESRGVVHIMKALAQHPVAAQSLAEDDSLQLMFHMIALGGTIPMLSHSDSFKKIAATTPPLHLAQLHRHVMQILGLLLTSDNGSTAKYIETHELVEVLLTPVMDFDAHTGNASYTVGVVSLLLNCIQLSCRSESGEVSLKHNFQTGRGY
ncbi:unnamed protein product [Sphagnum jensenii]|uniref:Dymeclin n=1 Tax=Sphagnum jensenii TaxID=128206 RepID=A0ABP0XK37_9BRYO